MKKLLMAAFVIASFITKANAQAGSVLVYGNLGFNTNKNGGVADPVNKATTGSFYINPGVGYQFDNHWTAGVSGGYNYFDDGEIAKTYKAGLFLRHSMPLAGIFSWYTQLDAGYQGETVGNSGFETKANGFYATVTPVISANVKNGFALNFAIGGLDYNSLKIKNGGPASSTFGFTFGQELSIGVSKNFGGK